MLGEDTVKKIFIAGDSTAANYPALQYPMMGWGQVLPFYLDGCAQVVNLAICGRSSMSFYKEGWLDVVRREIGSGDLFLIQFGHNDANKNDLTRYVDVDGDYALYLKKYIDCAREKGAIPVLMTPVARRVFEEGKAVSSHGQYPGAMAKLAEKEKVELVDMTALTEKMLEEVGEETSKGLYTWVEPGEFPSYPDGQWDDTHFRQEGAYKVAGIVAGELKKRDLI